MKSKRITAYCLSFCLLAPFAVHLSNAQAADSTREKLALALTAEVRSSADKARDASRKPMETLEFFGLQDDMKVLELFPGRGWYTKILGAVLKDSGQLNVALGLGYLGDSLEQWGYDHVRPVGTGVKLTPTSQRGVSDLELEGLGVSDLDMVLTFRNLHNLTEQGRRTLNRAVYAALKPGGIYGVIDHTRRHMEPATAELWRRVDPVQIIKELLDAGFEFEAWSDLHRRPADTLIHDSTHPTLQTDSDRFTLKFRKPRG